MWRPLRLHQLCRCVGWAAGPQPSATLAREGTGTIHAPREIKGATRSTTRRMGSKRQQPSPGDTCDASPDKTQSEGAADDEGGTA